MNNKVVNSDLSEQVFMNKKHAGPVAAIERRLILHVSEIETLALPVLSRLHIYCYSS